MYPTPSLTTSHDRAEAVPASPAPPRRIALLAMFTALLAGCAGSPTATDPGATAPTTAASAPAGGGDGPAPSSAPAVEVDGSAWEHVHNLALDGPRLVIGTHQGVWTQEPGEEPAKSAGPAFDVMGLALDGDRWLASGHPGRGQDAPSDLGLQESEDAGATWSPVSLEGEVDFHRLVATGDTVMGLSAHDGRLLRSRDGGRTWDDLGTPAVFNLALNPDEQKTVVATTQEGPVRSTDGGATFTAIKGAPLVAFVAWTQGTLYGLAPDGTVHVSTDEGATWSARGDAGKGQPGALAAYGDTVVALVGSDISESSDGGTRFRPRLMLHGTVGH